MEQKSKKIDVKIIVIIAIVVLAVIGIMTFASNKGIKLSTSNYTDYMSGKFELQQKDNDNKWDVNVVFATNGLSKNYDYSNIEIEVLITSKEYKINKIEKVKCNVNGYSSIKTGITYNWFSSNIEFDTIKKDLKEQIKSINGKLNPIK